MAQRKDLYSNSFSSVSSFILGNNKPKKPVKRKPPKYDGIDYNDGLAGALATMAGAPGVFLGESAINSLNSTLGDPSLIELYIDKSEKQKMQGLDKNAGRIRVRGSDLNKFIQSPSSFLDKALQGARAERKWALTVALLGGGAEVANTYMWAKKNNLSNSDAARLASSVWDLDKSIYTDQESLGIMTETALLKSGGRSIKEAEELNAKLVASVAKQKEGRQTVSRLWTGAASDVSDHIMSGALFKSQDEYSKFLLEKGLKDKERDLVLKLRAGTLTEPEEVSYANRLENDLKSAAAAGWPKITSQKTKLDALVSQSIPDPAARERFYQEFAKEYTSRYGKVDYTATGNLTNFGVREMLKDNYWAKAQLSTGADKEKYLRTIAAVDVLQRTKSPGDYSKPDYDKAREAVTSLKGQPGVSQSDIDGLLGQINKAESMYAKRYVKHRAHNEVETKWLKPLNNPMMSYENAPEAKLLLEAKLKTSRYSLISRGLAVDDPRVQEIDYALETLKSGFNPFGGGRPRMANMIMMYRSRGSMANFVPGLFTGASYADGVMSPGDWGGITMKYRMKDRWGVDKNGNPKLQVGEAKGFILQGRSHLPTAYQGLVNYYYLTPGSLIKSTLWNGEGLYYLAEQRRRRGITKMLSELDPDKIQNPTGSLAKYFEALKDDAGNVTGHRFMWEKVDGDFLGILEALKDSGYAELYRKYDKVFRGYESTVAWAHRFAMPERFFGNKGVIGAQRLKLQGKVVQFFGALSKNKEWNAALKLFGAGEIGLYQLVEAGVKIVFGTVLKALGPVGTVLSFVITDVIVSALVKISKPILDMSVFALMATVALFFLLLCTVISSPFTLANRLKTHAVQPPVEGVELEPLPGEFPDDPDAVVIDPTKDAICPINAGAICTQGPRGSYSHARMGTYAIDVSTGAGPFRAPTDGVVVSVRSSNSCPWGPNRGANYGGSVVFRSSDNIYYEVMHANPTVGTGPVEQGTVLATMAYGLPRSGCWTGAHYHIDTCFGSQSACVARSRSARWLNSKDWYNELKCNIRGC
ncbi:MAG: hypothetical protein QY318_02770 [Candidatus Dojkabacteria bacterium]|nr:MAG: hypothetical protein QY318_02770 [Candidatus Dojkabacteria bacterium]